MIGERSARSGVQVGLTLIELMVVVAVLAILATIAVPTYDRYVTGARRADGKAGLTAIAHAQERHFSVYQSYVSSLSTLGSLAGLDAEIANNAVSPKGHYALSVVASSTDFTATADPVRDDPDCENLTITAAGVKGASGPKGANCW